MPKWNWPDARGWIGVGAFALTIFVLIMLWTSRELREDEFFKAIATLIVGGYVKDVLGWAYQATKQGGELADKNAAIVKESATAGVAAAAVVAKKAADALPEAGKPTEVVVKNTEADPAIVTDAGAAPAEELPDYARG